MTGPRNIARQEFSSKTKGLALKRSMRDGVPHCESCGLEINARTGPIFEHVIPAGLGGDNSLENCKTHCFLCADIKTETQDRLRISKADRVFKKHHGINPAPRQKIKNAGFRQTVPQRTASRPIRRKNEITT